MQTKSPEDLAREEAKKRRNEMEHDWDAKEISYEELKPRTESPEPETYLIDVREPDEVIQGMIPSAVNLPLSELANSLYLSPAAFLEKHGFEKPPKTQQLIFYCRSGKRIGIYRSLTNPANPPNTQLTTYLLAFALELRVMIFEPSTASHLKPWLVRTLEPICDAEPGALADYILALLKHNVPDAEMRKELALQLDEFLEKMLRTKSYLPYSAASPPPPSPPFASKNLDNGIPIPLDALLSPTLAPTPERSLKRNIENDERDGRAPAKGPRLTTEGQFSRYSNAQDARSETRSTGGWSGRGDQRQGGRDNRAEMFGAGLGGGMVIPGMMMPAMTSMGQMNGRRSQVYQPPDQKRGICRDYHNNGYCARGATCKYSHGEDAVVPNMFPLNAMQLPFMSMFPGAGNPFGMAGGMGAAYDPHEARMDMRPLGNRNQRAPLLPRIQQEDGSQVLPTTAPGELPVIQDLTPSNHGTEKPRTVEQTDPETTSPTQTPPLQLHPPSSIASEYDANPTYDNLQNGQPYMAMNSSGKGSLDTRLGHASSLRPIRGRGRGRGGTFGGENPNFRTERRNDKTLVVEKIPQDKLTLEHVNEWFKRFGTVTNVAIDSINGKALISFSDHDEAYAAWKSEDAVFNNRFVKVFWHRPMEGHGSVGTRMLAASAPLVAKIAANDNLPGPPITSSNTSHKSPPSSLAAKQQLLEQQIAEQKSLMASLDKATTEEKKTIMTRLRKLGEEMQLPSTTRDAQINSTNDIEKKERERLDQELDIHGATGGQEESAEDLKAKLERLKAEAASLGISDASIEPSKRSYRARGRGFRGYRGFVRGGHPPRASMKLDNRPKKLLVQGVHEDKTQVVRDWYETTGQMDSLERLDSGDLVVAFKSRAAAEQGLAKGTNIATIGGVTISWYIGQPTAPKSAPPSTAHLEPSDIHMGPTQPSHSAEQMNSPRPDEEVVASGWGGDGDGEDGMGML
ncbi:hypothetical protein H0H93_014903 [Arthromyces matolae]|nr:hypothetical protein H0H93_014903 [Arthromyces matolae]